MKFVGRDQKGGKVAVALQLGGNYTGYRNIRGCKYVTSWKGGVRK